MRADYSWQREALLMTLRDEHNIDSWHNLTACLPREQEMQRCQTIRGFLSSWQRSTSLRFERIRDRDS